MSWKATAGRALETVVWTILYCVFLAPFLSLGAMAVLGILGQKYPQAKAWGEMAATAMYISMIVFVAFIIGGIAVLFIVNVFVPNYGSAETCGKESCMQKEDGPKCETCGGSGKVYEAQWDGVGAGTDLHCYECQDCGRGH
jgi:hypothetical protein